MRSGRRSDSMPQEFIDLQLSGCDSRSFSRGVSIVSGKDQRERNLHNAEEACHWIADLIW